MTLVEKCILGGYRMLVPEINDTHVRLMMLDPGTGVRFISGKYEA